MSNLPMIPMTWCQTNSTTIVHGDTRLAIHADGTMILDGNPKEAALGLVKYVIQREYVKGIQSWMINNTLFIDFNETGWTISILGQEEPAFFKDLAIEFDKIIKMKAFW